MINNIWQANNREYDVTKMNVEHIRNIIIVLGTKQDTWLKRSKEAQAQGYNIGPLFIQDKPVQEWLTILYKELHKRTGDKLNNIKEWLATWEKYDSPRT
jgi:hypothetical protein